MLHFDFQVVMEGVIGSSFASDIAVDVVTVEEVLFEDNVSCVFRPIKANPSPPVTIPPTRPPPSTPPTSPSPLFSKYCGLHVNQLLIWRQYYKVPNLTSGTR